MTALLLANARLLGRASNVGSVGATGGVAPTKPTFGGTDRGAVGGTGDGLVDVLVRGGVVVSVEEAGQGDGDGAERVDLGGRILMPGLWDAHVHLTQWALVRRRLDLSGARSAAEAVALVRDRLAQGLPEPGTALVGYGFRDALWPDVPTADLLDAVAGEVPVVLVSGDLHCAWLNTAGLRFAGVAEHPTGVLREAEWLPLAAVVDRAPDHLADAWVADAAAAAAARGVVGVVDLEITDNLTAWRRRFAAGFAALRVRAGVWTPWLDDVLAEGLRSGAVLPGTGGLLEQGPFKVVTDGSLNTRTAYCHDPYPGLTGPEAHGILSVPPAELVPLMARAHAGGLRCAIHAIGDHANTLALDAFAATGARGSVEHAQLLDPADLARFAQLGVVASVQPEHAMDDRDVADRHWAGRTEHAFAFGALDDAGAVLALGSDAPVAPLDPWFAIAAAVSRSRDGRAPWHPEQRIGLRTALAASTDGRGLVPTAGAPADLVVLDADPLELGAGVGGAGGGGGADGADGAAEALRTMPVAGTLLSGNWTHRTF
ncbi:amidohydrolase [Promicromonospora sukumoe]|uniref:amidohydrolase n=1 Tax=Promicromonospora sukumoe TaxID=88382 RepID=UPI000368AFEC|nr:amidohydrolase [Promicromonospora sukumoe]